MESTSVMTRTVGIALGLAVAAALAFVTPAEAGGKPSTRSVDNAAEHPSTGYYRKGPRVRGYVARRGGYSYSIFDTINTYGDSRTQYGSSNTFRDPMIDRQTRFGPFDHGFFFDSGIAPRGGDSPYLN
jgi:hypothetical protein